MPYTIESHEFAARDFIGGDAALDFVNTVTGRDQEPRDWLDSYARLLEWATLARLLPEKNLRALTKKMHSEPAAAARALTRAKELREELFALVSAVASGNAPPKSALRRAPRALARRQRRTRAANRERPRRRRHPCRRS